MDIIQKLYSTIEGLWLGFDYSIVLPKSGYLPNVWRKKFFKSWCNKRINPIIFHGIIDKTGFV